MNNHTCLFCSIGSFYSVGLQAAVTAVTTQLSCISLKKCHHLINVHLSFKCFICTNLAAEPNLCLNDCPIIYCHHCSGMCSSRLTFSYSDAEHQWVHQFWAAALLTLLATDMDQRGWKMQVNISATLTRVLWAIVGRKGTCCATLCIKQAHCLFDPTLCREVGSKRQRKNAVMALTHIK